jgi:hypothetical protein
VLTSTYWADGAADLSLADAFPSMVRGARLQGVAVASTTAGDLQADDIVVLQWAYDAVDAQDELQVVRLARSATDTDAVLGTWDASTFNSHGQIGIDAAGRIAVGSDTFADESGPALRRLSYASGSWSSADITPSIGVQSLAPLAVAPDGTVFTVAPDFGDNDAEIWALDPVTESWGWFATYDQRCCIREYRALATDADGALYAALGSPREVGDYIAPIAYGADVAWRDRIAESTSYGVRGLVGGADGALFVVHEERDPDSPGVTIGNAIYRLAPTSGSGGDGGGDSGGGPPAGKGKNK